MCTATTMLTCAQLLPC